MSGKTRLDPSLRVPVTLWPIMPGDGGDDRDDEDDWDDEEDDEEEWEYERPVCR